MEPETERLGAHYKSYLTNGLTVSGLKRVAALVAENSKPVGAVATDRHMEMVRRWWLDAPPIENYATTGHVMLPNLDLDTVSVSVRYPTLSADYALCDAGEGLAKALKKGPFKSESKIVLLCPDEITVTAKTKDGRVAKPLFELALLFHYLKMNDKIKGGPIPMTTTGFDIRLRRVVVCGKGRTPACEYDMGYEVVAQVVVCLPSHHSGGSMFEEDAWDFSFSEMLETAPRNGLPFAFYARERGSAHSKSRYVAEGTQVTLWYDIAYDWLPGDDPVSFSTRGLRPTNQWELDKLVTCLQIETRWNQDAACSWALGLVTLLEEMSVRTRDLRNAIESLCATLASQIVTPRNIDSGQGMNTGITHVGLILEHHYTPTDLESGRLRGRDAQLYNVAKAAYPVHLTPVVISQRFDMHTGGSDSDESRKPLTPLQIRLREMLGVQQVYMFGVEEIERCGFNQPARPESSVMQIGRQCVFAVAPSSASTDENINTDQRNFIAMGLHDCLQRSMRLASALLIDIKSREKDCGDELLPMAHANLVGLIRQRKPIVLLELGSLRRQVLHLYAERGEADHYQYWQDLIMELRTMETVQEFYDVYTAIFPDDVPKICEDMEDMDGCNAEFLRHMRAGILNIIKETLPKIHAKEHLVDLYDICYRPGIGLLSYWADAMQEVPFAKLLSACVFAYGTADVDDYACFSDTVFSLALDHVHDPPEDFLSLPASRCPAATLVNVVFEECTYTGDGERWAAVLRELVFIATCDDRFPRREKAEFRVIFLGFFENVLGLGVNLGAAEMLADELHNYAESERFSAIGS